MFDVAEQQRSSTVDQQLFHLIGVESGVERNRGPAGCNDA
jgi:hypothetical protein